MARRSSPYCPSLPPITPRVAREAAADDVLIADSFEGFADPVPGIGRRHNPRELTPRTSRAMQMVIEQATGAAETGKPAKPWKADPHALSLYAGHDGLLVRTALIRSPSFDAKRQLPRISGPEDTARLLAHLRHSDQEHMVVLALNARHGVQAIYEVGIGTSRGVMVQPRDVVKILMLSGAVAAVIAHNHPSGDPTPSVEDVEMTKTLKTAFGCLGYSLLDHVIVARDGYTSFFQLGLLRDDDDK